MTTVELFKNHPNKENIQFIVLPLVTEVLKNVSDIGIDCFELMAKFGEGQPAT